jgi:hypothetical protein
MLWTAVDVRKEYGHLSDPDCEHLAIAVLVLEGAIDRLPRRTGMGLLKSRSKNSVPRVGQASFR